MFSLGRRAAAVPARVRGAGAVRHRARRARRGSRSSASSSYVVDADPESLRADDAGRRRRSGRSRSRRCPIARWSSRCSGPTATPRAHDLRRSAGRRSARAASPARTAPSCSPISVPTSCSRTRSTIRCSSTCARRNGTRPTSSRGVASADVVLARRRPGDVAGRLDPLVTVSITRDRARRPRRRSRPPRGGAAGAQRQPVEPRPHAIGRRSPSAATSASTSTGAFAALGAVTAWRRASRTGVAEARRRVDARSDADDVRHRAHADGAVPRRAQALGRAG